MSDFYNVWAIECLDCLRANNVSTRLLDATACLLRMDKEFEPTYREIMAEKPDLELVWCEFLALIKTKFGSQAAHLAKITFVKGSKSLKPSNPPESPIVLPQLPSKVKVRSLADQFESHLAPQAKKLKTSVSVSIPDLSLLTEYSQLNNLMMG